LTIAIRVRAAASAVVCCLALSAGPAAAQGNGHGNAYGHSKKPGAPGGQQGAGPSAAGSPELGVIGTGIRNFGSWLDDASVMPEGKGAFSVAFGYWRTPGYREFDFPAIDGAVGLTRRVHVGMSVPVYHASEPGGPVARGLGDFYLSTKIQLRDPSAEQGRMGVAISPVLEVLSYAPGPEAGRVNWALPVSLEVQGDGWRVFGSTGYFSRGALFGSGAVEVTLSDRISAIGAISQSHSIKQDDLSTALGYAQSRTDVSGGVNVSVSPAMMVFGSIGRTLSQQDPNSTTLVFTSGVSFSFDAWRAR
jgi:hypothetical protein